MDIKRTARGLVAATLTAAAVAAPVYAHHSFSIFDASQTKTFTGVVTRVNPDANHLQIFFAPMNEERNGSKFLGRDHHPRAFTVWLAGAGIKKGITLGATDELGYNVVEDKVHVHDLQATILHLLGLDHTRLTYKFQGRNFRLTDVSGELVKKLLA